MAQMYKCIIEYHKPQVYYHSYIIEFLTKPQSLSLNNDEQKSLRVDKKQFVFLVFATTIAYTHKRSNDGNMS